RQDLTGRGPRWLARRRRPGRGRRVARPREPDGQGRSAIRGRVMVAGPRLASLLATGVLCVASGVGCADLIGASWDGHLPSDAASDATGSDAALETDVL